MNNKFYYDKNSIAERLAAVSFVLLFPGFFIYNFLVGKNYIFPFLGGYFGIISASLLAPLIFFGFKRSFIKNDMILLLFYSILFCLFFVSVFNYSIGNPVGYEEDMFVWSISGLIFNLVLFLVGANLNVKYNLKFFMFFIFLFALIVLFNIGDSGIFYIKQNAGDFKNYVATYQGFARSIVVVLIVFMAVSLKKPFIFFMVFFIGLVTLFFNGARTEFALFFISIILFVVTYSLKSIKIVLYCFAFILVAIVSIYCFYDYIPSSRMMQLFDIKNSSSGLSRIKLHSYGLSLILDNPILGKYGGYTAIGGVGSYPHSILSAWVNLGFFGFLLYVLLFFLILKDVFVNFFKYRHLEEFRVLFILALFVTGALLASKDYSYMLVGMLVGFYVNYKKAIRGI